MVRDFTLIIFILLSGVGYLYSCDAPILLSADSITTHSARITWYGSAEAITYQVDVQEGTHSPSIYPLYPDLHETELVIGGLKSGTLYTIYLRALCDSEDSKWVKLPIRTAYKTLNSCFISFPIQDNNCGFPGREKLKIYVDSNDIGGFIDPVLTSVSFIIDHPWPSDLSATLISPSGREVPLFNNLSLGYKGLGNPLDTSCTEVLTLNDNSCDFIQDASGPFIGEYRPLGELRSISSEEVLGFWYLDICDDAPGDVGTIKSLKLSFGSGACVPVSHDLVSFTDTIASFHLSHLAMNDTVIFKYGESPFHYTDTSGALLDTFSFSGTMDTTISLHSLLPGREYSIYAYRLCEGKNSSISCPEKLTTLCNSPTAVSDFNNHQVLDSQCGDSTLINGIWYQDEETLYAWKVGKGSSKTDYTGPSASPYGDDNYIYFDASDQSCGNVQAVLKSSCIYIPHSENACGMLFDYSMYGNETSTLLLRITSNESGTWDTLFIKHGDQGDSWYREIIDLRAYDRTAVYMEFIAGPSRGARGDIALDNITLMGATPLHRDGYLMYGDKDGDNYGVTEDSTRFCRRDKVPGYSFNPGDCDDNNPNINPGVPEIPCNLIDDNCNGLIDEVPPDTIPIFRTKEKENPSCRGIADGVLEFYVENYSDYTVEWNTGDTTARIENLSAGVYYATVTSSSGCLFRTEFYELKNSSNINALVTSTTSPTCEGLYDGRITVSAGGGIAPYQYTWDTGDNTATIENITSGVYNVTVNDATGCLTVLDSIVLDSRYHGRAQIDVYNSISCHGGQNGSILAGLQGAQPQSYIWNTGDTTRFINGLAEGFYTCTMTFMDNCIIETDSFYLGEPDSLYFKKLNIISPTCPSEKNGSIITQVGGGTPPYEYILSAFDTLYNGPVFTDLSAGLYRLIIRDANNCSLSIDSLELTQIDSFSVSSSIVDTRCPLSSDGSIHATISGGTEPYNYVWSNIGLGTFHIDDLSPGKYHLTVVDDLGCKSQKFDFTVEQGQESLNVTVSILDTIYCGDSTGTLIAKIQNEKDKPVEYNWSNGIVHKQSFDYDTLRHVSPGRYNVTVTDANGCVGTTAKVELSERDTLVYDSLIIQQLRCLGDSSGSIEIALSYYHAPLSFEWNAFDGDSIITGLPAGSYQVTITDAMGCKAISPLIDISKTNPMWVEHFYTEIINDLYEIEVKPTGGVKPYSIQWQDDSTSSLVRSYLEAGEYFYVLSDQLDCTIDSVIVIEVTAYKQYYNQPSIVVFPNPTEHYLNVRVNEPLVQNTYTLRLYSSQGVLVREYGHVTQIEMKDMPPGVYYLELNAGNAHDIIKVIKL